MKPESETQHRASPAVSRRLVVAGVVVLLLIAGAVGRLAMSTAAPAPTQEARAHAIGEQLACPICQGLSVADSPSALAQQMRDVISTQVAAGRSDGQIEQYFVARYGPAILLTPPKQGFTLLAWWVPVLVIVLSAAGLVLAAYRWSRRSAAEEALPELTDEDRRRYGERLAAQLPGDADAQPADPPVHGGSSAIQNTGELPASGVAEGRSAWQPS